MITVYGIRNKETGKIYIGSTSDIRNRLSCHYSSLKYGYHYNKLLQNDWNLYGKNMFETIEFESFDSKEESIKREQELIDLYNGYNLRPADLDLGWELSEETKNKMSISAKEIAMRPGESRKRSDKAIQQHLEENLGRNTWSPESEQKFLETQHHAMLKWWQEIQPKPKFDMRGVHYINGRRKPWRVAFTIRGSFTCLGYFLTKEEAITIAQNFRKRNNLP